MKKIIALLLAILMVAGLLAGCNNNTQQDTTGDTPDSTDAVEPDDTADEPDGDGEADDPKDASNLKIALLIPGLLGDKSFFDATNETGQLLAAELGCETKSVEMGTDQTKWYPTFVDYCEQDYDLIMTVSATVNDVLLEVCEEYPDQLFMNLACSAEVDVPDNLYVMEVKQHELGFLSGIVAALKAQEMGEGVVGFIGGMDIPGLNEFLIGYIDGAQYISEDIKVSYSYVGDFSDPSKAKELAQVMYSDAAVIFHAAGASGLGVFDAAKEMGEKGVERYAIGVDSDQATELKNSDPDAAALIITSAYKQIPQMTLDAVVRFAAGEIEFGQQIMNGLKENAAGIAKNEFYEAIMSEADRAAVEEIEAAVVSGELQLRNTVGMTTEEVEEIRTAARP